MGFSVVSSLSLVVVQPKKVKPSGAVTVGRVITSPEYPVLLATSAPEKETVTVFLAAKLILMVQSLVALTVKVLPFCVTVAVPLVTV